MDEEYVQEHISTDGIVAPVGGASPTHSWPLTAISLGVLASYRRISSGLAVVALIAFGELTAAQPPMTKKLESPIRCGQRGVIITCNSAFAGLQQLTYRLGSCALPLMHRRRSVFAARTIITFLSVEWTPSRPKEYVQCYARP